MDKKVYSQLAEGFELLAAGYRSLAEQGAEATPEAAPEPTKKITIEQVRAVMSAKSDEGKTAQVKALLMKGECIDPRFKYVARGCAEVVEWLGQKENPQGKGWATGAGYGEKIVTILKAILATAGGAAPTPVAVSFKVRVTATDLNIRTGPGTNTAATGKFTGAGVFTITEVKDGPGSAKGWGRLKSGAGWIALDFAQKI
ncbi:hypothetical protein AALD01_12930 [Oscillospiraceae bacterium 21-37]